MKFSYYNISSKIILLIVCFGPFLGMSIWSMLLGPGFLKIVSVLLFFLFIVFFYKCIFIHVTITEDGVTYKSLLQTKHLAWEDIKDVLIVVRERRSSPDYYRFNEWIDEGRSGKSYFVLFRTTEGFPQDPMFMFSAPIAKDYISLQYRENVKEVIYNYYYPKK